MLTIERIKGENIEQEVNFDFLSKELDSNGSIKVLRLRDCSGRIISFTGQWDTIATAVEKLPEKIKKYVVKGTMADGLVDVEKIFDSEEKAKEVKETAENKDGTAKLEIIEIETIKE